MLSVKTNIKIMGVKYYFPGESYNFNFRPRFFSLYFCKLEWKNAFHYFDIYIQDRDQHNCKTDCYWLINKWGPCMVDTNNVPITCYPWNRVVIGRNQLHRILNV